MQRQTSKILQDIFSKYKTFLFDCDGVLYKSQKQIQENFWVLNELKQQGKNIYFISNNCTRSREEIADRINNFGYKPDLNQIYISSYLTAQFIAQKYPQIKKVYCIGKAGIKIELNQAGIEVVDADIHNGKIVEHEYVRNELYNDIQDIDGVVVGFDNTYNFYKQTFAVNCFKKNPKCLFFATENTSRIDLSQHTTLPGVKSIYSGIQVAAQLGDPLVVTKPSPGVLEMISDKDNIKKSEMVMIGDTVNVDIEMARQFEIDSILVFTGQSHLTNRLAIEQKFNQEEKWVQYKQQNKLYLFNSFIDSV